LYSVDGGGVTTISCNAGAEAAAFVDIAAGSVGTHTLTLNTDIAGNVIILGVAGYDTTVSELKIYKAGWAGSRTTAWIETTSPWSPMNNVAAFSPDLVLVCLGINHWIASEASAPVATYQTELETLVDYYKGICDVAIVTPVPSDTASASQARQDLFRTAMSDVATAKSVKLIDVYSHFVDYATANANGWMQNATHPNAAGYAAKADFIYNKIKVPTTYGV